MVEEARWLSFEYCSSTNTFILSECWTTQDKAKTSHTAAEMNFIRQMAKYTEMDHKQHEYILQE
jgi:hypothetical protein